MVRCSVVCYNDPYPYRGGGRGGDKTNLSNSTFLRGNGGAKRKYDHGSAIFWRDAIPTHVLLQSDMCLDPPELSDSI